MQQLYEQFKIQSMLLLLQFQLD